MVGFVIGLGIYSRGPNRRKAIPLNRGSIYQGRRQLYTFSESRGGQEGWLTGAVSVVFVGFSDGSSAGNKIGQTNAETLS